MSRKQRRGGRPVTYWHGGRPGRQPGDLLLPPRATKGAALPAGMSAQELAQYPGQDGWVYITTDRSFALTHADSADGIGGGHLYRVEPLDKPMPDPDGIAGMDVQCRRARVLAVVERDVYLPPREIVRGQARHTLYIDGSPGADPVTGRWLAPQEPALRTPEMLESIDQQNAAFDEAQAIYEQVGAEGWKAMRRSAGAPPTMSPPTH